MKVPGSSPGEELLTLKFPINFFVGQLFFGAAGEVLCFIFAISFLLVLWFINWLYFFRYNIQYLRQLWRRRVYINSMNTAQGSDLVEDLLQ